MQHRTAVDFPSYDLTEATCLFIRSHERRDPGKHREARLRAASALLRAVAEAALASGYEVASERGGQVISHPGKGAVYLGLRESSGEPFVVPVDGGPPTSPPIVYDASLGMFVGEKDDTFYEPVPGSPKKHQSAVAAVAETIADLIDRRAAPRAR